MIDSQVASLEVWIKNLIRFKLMKAALSSLDDEVE